MDPIPIFEVWSYEKKQKEIRESVDEYVDMTPKAQFIKRERSTVPTSKTFAL